MAPNSRARRSATAASSADPLKRTLVLLAGAAAVLALAGLTNFLGIADLPFYTKGEPREALVVQEMARGGGLVLPLRNGDEIPSKPPMFHWLGLGASSLLGGVSELTTRLPSAVLGTALPLLIYFFAASVSRIRCGWLSAIALLFSFEWFRAARTARVDMTLTAFLSGALLLFAVMQRSGFTRGRCAVFWLALAAATLTKGPLGLLLPLLVIVVHSALSPGGNMPRETLRHRVARIRSTFRDLHALPGLAFVFVVSGAWYAAAYATRGDAFLETHALRENVFRVLDAERFSSGHSHGVFYLFGQFFLGAFPWSLSAPALAWWLWRGRPLDDTQRFLVVWFVVVFVFFLIPDSKRGVYLLPAYPAAALVFGLVLGPGPEDEAQRRVAGLGWNLGSLVLALIGLAGVVVASGLPIEDLVLPRLRPHEAGEVAAAIAALRAHAWFSTAAGVLVLACAAAAAKNATGAHWLRASVPLVVALAVTLGAFVAPVERSIAGIRTLAAFPARARAVAGNAPVAFASGSFDYGLVYYAGRNIPRDDRARRESDYLFAFARKDGSAPDDAEIALRSAGTGARGRSNLLLVRMDRENARGAKTAESQSARH